MSNLSDLIDKLDDDGVLHSADSTAMCGSGTVGASSPVVSSSWVPCTDLYFLICIDCFLCIVFFTNTLVSFFGRVFFWDS